ncbi:uncharacterized protein LOC132314110 [Cornus florida]|uniref:uncharacterized protein LOC132314110 n=1 Tax=Cornus florida TaxID=4283 RepID=UPI002897E1C1|nr:uncharacterized protein LOC132314110 [Cornus florida]
MQKNNLNTESQSEDSTSESVEELDPDNADESGVDYSSRPRTAFSKQPPREGESLMKDENLQRCRVKYSIPSSIRLHKPKPEDRCSSIRLGEVCFFESTFAAGLRFPIHPFVEEILSHLKIAPSQIAPNSWRIIIGCLIVWGKCGNGRLTVNQFLHFYYPKKKKDNFWYFQCRSKKTFILVATHENNKGWKSRFFFISGAYGKFPTIWNNSDPTEAEHVGNASSYPVKTFSDLITDEALDLYVRAHSSKETSTHLEKGKKLSKRLLAQVRSSNLPSTPASKKLRRVGEGNHGTSASHGVLSGPTLVPLGFSGFGGVPTSFESFCSVSTNQAFSHGESILDDANVANDRLHKMVVKDDTARLQSLPASELSKKFLHLISQGTTYSVVIAKEYEKLSLEMASLKAKYEDVTSTLKIKEDDLTNAKLNFQDEKVKLTKEYSDKLEFEKLAAVESFKNSDEFKVLIGKACCDGFDRFKALVGKDRPDIDFSRYDVLSESEEED